MARAYGTPIAQTIDGPACNAAESQALRHTIPGDYLFRVEAVTYSTCHLSENDAEVYGSIDPRLEVFALEVLRFTEHGATLRETTGARHRWVDLRDGAKQYASRTVAEAVEQFATRRRSQIWILQRQLARAERELALTKPCVLHLPAPYVFPEPDWSTVPHHSATCDQCGTRLMMRGKVCPNKDCVPPCA